MFEWLLVLQIITTLLVIPILSYKRYEKVASSYSKAYGDEVEKDVNAYVAASAKPFYALVGMLFILGMGVALQAIIGGNELFYWDNQAGLMVLFLVAVVPVIVLSIQQKKLLSRLKRIQGSIRSASLTPQPWSSAMPKPMLLMLVGLQFIFIGTVMYFVNHPFQGFAGYTNLFGLLALDAVFGVTTWMIYHSKKLSAIQIPQQRHAIKARAIHINSILWILALLQITVSMWISGLGLDGVKLITQSLYLQLILLLTAFILSLPNPDSMDKPPASTNMVT